MNSWPRSAPNPSRTRRGFVHALTLTAEDWLAHADEIYWRPGQNRPCPGGAQPLRTVHLTTWPDLDVSRRLGAITIGLCGRLTRLPLDGPVLRSDITKRLLAAEWPRITFPPPPEGVAAEPFPVMAAWDLGEFTVPTGDMLAADGFLDPEAYSRILSERRASQI